MIPMSPMPKPRDGRYGWKNGVNVKQKYFDWKNAVHLAARAAWGAEPFDGPVNVKIVFALVKRGRCDLDNLIGGCLDALQGVLFEDDRQVVKVSGSLFTMSVEDRIIISVARCSSGETQTPSNTLSQS
jgi:Holliday junction resolvase RusA-like endonuclease